MLEVKLELASVMEADPTERETTPPEEATLEANRAVPRLKSRVPAISSAPPDVAATFPVKAQPEQVAVPPLDEAEWRPPPLPPESFSWIHTSPRVTNDVPESAMAPPRLAELDERADFVPENVASAASER